MKNKTLFGGVALSLSFLMVAGAMAGVSGKKVAEVKATPLSYNITKLIVIDESSWNFRTLWTDNYGFSSGYTISDFEAFVHDYYVTDLSASWDKEGSTKGYKRVSDGFNLCAGGTSGTYEFVFPEWVEYCSIQVENNGNSRYVNYLNNLKDTNDQVIGDGHLKEVSIYANSTGGWPAIGSAATTTAFDTTVSIVVKTDASTQIDTDSIQMSKYDHLGAYAKAGYTFDGWYTNATLTTPFSGLVLDNATLYAKMTADADVFTVTVGDGSPVTMVSQDKGEYYAQYKAVVDVTAGEDLAFTKNGDSISATMDNADNNNYYLFNYAIKGILETASNADIYLKITEVSTDVYSYEFWISGRTHYYFLKRDNSTMIPLEDNPGDANEVYCTEVEFWKSYTIQLYAGHSATSFGGLDSASDGGWSYNGSSLFGSSGGVFDMYLKKTVDDTHNIAYFQYSSTNVFKVKVGSDSYQEMTDDTSHAGEGVSKQYKYSTTVAAGDSISFVSFAGSNNYALPATADSTALNNVDTANNKVIAGGSVDIYLKKLSAGGWQYYISGRTLNYYLAVGATLIPLTPNQEQAGQYMATSVAIGLNEVVRLYATSWYDGTLDEFSTGTWSVVDGRITCGAAGTYNVYYTPADSNKLYFGNPSAADVEATAYAQLFLNTLKPAENPICTEYGDTDVEDLQDAWQSLATAFAGKGTEAKGILKAASTSGAADVNEFARLYDWIYAHYSTELAAKGANFVDRAVASSRSPYIFSPFGADSTSNIIAIVTIISLISVTSIGAFFYVRKRKHN